MLQRMSIIGAQQPSNPRGYSHLEPLEAEASGPVLQIDRGKAELGRSEASRRPQILAGGIVVQAWSLGPDLMLFLSSALCPRYYCA
jgi:hypothetical protein